MLQPRAVKRKAPTASTSKLAASAVKTDSQDTKISQDVKESTLLIAPTKTANEDNEVEGPSDESATLGVQQSLEETEPDEASIKAHAERLALLSYGIEECLSDWSLTLRPEFLSKYRDNGFIHISHLLSIEPVSSLEPSMAEIQEALSVYPSTRVQLDEAGFQLSRTSPPVVGELSSTSTKDWSERTFYLENIPAQELKGKGPSVVHPLRVTLEDLLGTQLEVLRLPELNSSNKGKEQDRRGGIGDSRAGTSSQHGGLYKTSKPSIPLAPKDEAKDDSNGAGKEEEQAETPAERKKRERSYQIPTKGGGPYKGHAFVVLRNAEMAEAALSRWNWDERGKRKEGQVSRVDEEEAEDHDDEDDDELENDAGSECKEPRLEDDRGEESSEQAERAKPQPPERSIQERADLCGFRVMPITKFNALRSVYLAYFRDLTALREAHEAARNGEDGRNSRGRWHSNARDGTSSRDDAHRNKRRRGSRSPSPFTTDRSARKSKKAGALSPTLLNADRWERKPLSPSPPPEAAAAANGPPTRYYRADMEAEEDFPKGCVVFVKHVHPRSITRDLRALFVAILESEEKDGEGEIEYVDHARNVNSCHVRFSNASLASFFASYFSDPKSPMFHSSPSSTTPSSAFARYRPTSTTDEDVDCPLRPVEAIVMTGTPESIYWSKVPMSAREGHQTKPVEGIDSAPSKYTDFDEDYSPW